MPSEGLSKKDYDYYSALYGDSDRQGRATTREDRYSEGHTNHGGPAAQVVKDSEVERGWFWDKDPEA
ncbi:hypothetical protein LTR56_014878 [Elasticomyces elasticus]|nr:hypothetical protein LTR22_021181 [Elasticomyces elasticus]KAK3635106.1 hypothetical protein LTR56_014878 [Elasticomyces elasticus]KAK5749891.1 hypothetical protein LTS12_020037 [Elasticomyces elasticus]